MKNKKLLHIIKLPLIGGAVCILLFILADTVSNGYFLEWLANRITYVSFNYTDSGIIELHGVDWSAVKVYAFLFLTVSVIFWLTLISLVFFYTKRMQQREECRIISEYLKKYVIGGEPLPAEIPQEHEMIFTEISGIRTSFQEKEQLLRMESQRKNDLIVCLAHDLRTPLTSVIGYLSLIRDESEISDSQRNRFADIALKKSYRLELLIGELFETARFDLTDMELETKTVDLSVMTQQLIYEFEPMLSDKRLKISSVIASDIHIKCDVEKIERVIDNLIRNAISYSFPESVITVRLFSENKNAVMVIENPGRTIPPEKLNRIFERFFRADESRSSETGGSGLGLAIAKRITELHGGTISAESKNETIRFTVTLPCADVRKK